MGANLGRRPFTLLASGASSRGSHEWPPFLPVSPLQHAPGVPKILVGNRLHLAFKRQVPTEQAQAYAERLGVTFFEVSPLCNFNITESFTELARTVLLRHGMDRLWRPSKGRPPLGRGTPRPQRRAHPPGPTSGRRVHSQGGYTVNLRDLSMNSFVRMFTRGISEVWGAEVKAFRSHRRAWRGGAARPHAGQAPEPGGTQHPRPPLPGAQTPDFARTLPPGPHPWWLWEEHLTLGMNCFQVILCA